MKKTHPKTFRNHQSLGLLVSTLMLCLIAVSVHGKTIRLTLQHMEQPPTRVEAMQVLGLNASELEPVNYDGVK